MIHQCSFFRFALADNQHIQIKMQGNPQNDIDNQDISDIAIRQQQQGHADKK